MPVTCEIIGILIISGDSHLRCRVVNRPYDIFGTWFSDQHLISGDLQWLAHLVSQSVLWLTKANQEVDSEHVPIMTLLYKFYNKKASSIRGIMIANCPWMDDNDVNDEPMVEAGECSKRIAHKDDDVKRAGNPLSHHKLSQPGPSSPVAGCSSDADMRDQDELLTYTDGSRSIHYLDDFRKEYDDFQTENRLDEYDDDDDDEEDDINDDDDDQMCKFFIHLIDLTHTIHGIFFFLHQVPTTWTTLTMKKMMI